MSSIEKKEKTLGEVIRGKPSKDEFWCEAQGGYADQDYCESWCGGDGCRYWDFVEKVCKYPDPTDKTGTKKHSLRGEKKNGVEN